MIFFWISIIFLILFCRVLIEGVKYHADNPSMIGKTFLRLERDFDKHVIYCRDEPNAQDFYHDHKDVREFFQVSLKKSIFHFFNMIYGAQSIVRDQNLCELFVFALQLSKAADETFQNQQMNESVLFDFFCRCIYSRWQISIFLMHFILRQWSRGFSEFFSIRNLSHLKEIFAILSVFDVKWKEENRLNIVILFFCGNISHSLQWSLIL